MLGAGASALPYAVLLYMLPLCYLVTRRRLGRARRRRKYDSLLSHLFIKNRDDVTNPARAPRLWPAVRDGGIALNLVLFVGKFFAGTVSGSVAITADAFNNLSDAGSSVVTLLGFRLAGKKPDPEHPSARTDGICLGADRGGADPADGRGAGEVLRGEDPAPGGGGLQSAGRWEFWWHPSP